MTSAPTQNTTPFLDRERQLAETYTDGWDRVREYREAMQWHTSHPEQGSHVASQALELPRGRLRTWFEGGKPDPVYAIETADSGGWLEARPGERVFEGFVVLHAWVLAGGSIGTESFVPSFAIGVDDPDRLAREAFSAVGSRSREVHTDATTRGREIRPRGRGGSHLGRFLAAVYNAPVGEKRYIGPETLEWLNSVPQPTQLRWSRTYVQVRGAPLETANNNSILLAEERKEQYRRALADRFRRVVENQEGVTATAQGVLLRGSAAHWLSKEITLPPEALAQQ